MSTWNFYLADSDRSSGWSNHTFVLQFVATGTGRTMDQAWEHALSRDDGLGVSEFFHLPERLTAIRDGSEITYEGRARR